MKALQVSKVNEEGLEFFGGVSLYSEHITDCCEYHYLDLTDLSLEDFDGLEFDLSNDEFFERVDGFGIRLLPTNGQPISIPGHGDNNGYYSSHLVLVIADGGHGIKTYDITECQDY